MKVEYPSSVFPPLPAISLTLPKEWLASVTPGTLLSAIKQENGNGFAANVIVTSVRDVTGASLGDSLAEVELMLSSMPEAQVLAPVEADFDGRTAEGRAAVFVDPAAGTVAQFHVFILAEQAACSDIIHITGTIGGNRVEDDFDELREIFASAEVRVG